MGTAAWGAASVGALPDVRPEYLPPKEGRPIEYFDAMAPRPYGPKPDSRVTNGQELSGRGEALRPVPDAWGGRYWDADGRIRDDLDLAGLAGGALPGWYGPSISALAGSAKAAIGYNNHLYSNELLRRWNGDSPQVPPWMKDPLSPRALQYPRGVEFLPGLEWAVQNRDVWLTPEPDLTLPVPDQYLPSGDVLPPLPRTHAFVSSFGPRRR